VCVLVLFAEEYDLSVRTSREDPRLKRVETQSLDPFKTFDLVAPENFHRDDKGVFHKVIVHHPVEDMARPIIRSTRKKGMTRVERNRGNRQFMIT